TVKKTDKLKVKTISKNGCESKWSNLIYTTANPVPEKPEIIIDGNLAFCEGGNVRLSVPSGVHSYEWSNGSTNNEINVNQTGNYKVKITNSYGCESLLSEPVKITVWDAEPDPKITISGDTTFCLGEEVILTANAGRHQYQWSNGEKTQSITVKKTDELKVKTISENGCESKWSNLIYTTANPVPEKPFIDVNGKKAFCSGGNTKLSVFQNEEKYLWSTGETSKNIDVSETGSYTVKTTNIYGCESLLSEPVEITVWAAEPDPVITASGPLSFCFGDTIKLSATKGRFAYEWSNGEKTPSINIWQSEIVSVKTISDKGCESKWSDKAKISVFKLDKPTITGEKSVCGNQSEVIYKTPAKPSCTYQWQLDNYRLIEGVNTPELTVNWGKKQGTTNLTVTKTDKETGCVFVSDNYEVYVSSDTVPANIKIIRKAKSDVLVCMNWVANSTYRWLCNGLDKNWHKQFYAPAKAGLYKVEIKFPNGCKTLSDDFTFGSKKNSSLSKSPSDEIQKPLLNVYPVPAYAEIIVEIFKMENPCLKIFDSFGKCIYSNEEKSNEIYNRKTIKIENLPTGIYYIQISNGKEKITKKFIKQ
ncbi:MAG: hypothetical protein CSA05_00025, partial [Bacteroidia bacterium]